MDLRQCIHAMSDVPTFVDKIVLCVRRYLNCSAVSVQMCMLSGVVWTCSRSINIFFVVVVVVPVWQIIFCSITTGVSYVVLSATLEC